MRHRKAQQTQRDKQLQNDINKYKGITITRKSQTTTKNYLYRINQYQTYFKYFEHIKVYIDKKLTGDLEVLEWFSQ